MDAAVISRLNDGSIIDVNAGFSKNSTGFEIYFPGFKGESPEQGGSKEILKDMARNKFLNDSVRLAQLIQKHMDKVFPRKSRGLRDAHVLALEGLSIPAVVVEIGFATNPEDRKTIVDAKTQAAVAHALCQSIKPEVLCSPLVRMIRSGACWGKSFVSKNISLFSTPRL